MRITIVFGLFVSLCWSNGALGDQAPPKSNFVEAKIVSANCSALYPARAIRLGEEGKVVLAVSIDATGKITKVGVAQSSGILELDVASYHCALQTTLAQPATRDGVAIASIKRFSVNWSLQNTPSAIGKVCDSALTGAQIASFVGDFATLQFHVETDGSVDDPFIITSNGDATFNAAAMQCALQQHYPKVPIGSPWGGEVRVANSELLFSNEYGLPGLCGEDQIPPWGPSAKDIVVAFDAVTPALAGKDGLKTPQIANTVVEQSSGDTNVDQAALACLRKWELPYIRPAGSVRLRAHFFLRQGHVYVQEVVAD